jgi:hypothetical protein
MSGRLWNGREKEKETLLELKHSYNDMSVEGIKK